MGVFREKGFRGASMRDVALGAGILSGSLYHHFSSKDALYVEAHGIALDNATFEIRRAISAYRDPWERLEAACLRHLEILVSPDSATIALMSELPRVEPALRAQLIIHRDRFEMIYRELVEALPLASSIDREIYRILLISQINAAPTWFKLDGKMPLPEVVRQIMLVFRSGA